MAAPSRTNEREAREREADDRWRASFDPYTKKSNRFNREAAADSAKLGVIRWLAHNWAACAQRLRGTEPATSIPNEKGSLPTGGEEPESELQQLAHLDVADDAVVKAIDKLGSAIAKPTSKVIDDYLEESAKPLVRRDLTKHFWCDLFATLAQALELFEKALDKIPNWVTDAILHSEHQKKRKLVTRPLVKLAVKKAWSVVEQMIDHSFNHKKVLFALRVLGVLCCPAPEKHRAVVKYCVVPLGNKILEKEIKERLRAVLPEDLIQGLDVESEPESTEA
ncbi:hypothetical protein BKA01_003326 [Pseudonocardia eucalypti]|uniref:hypothetical protein n=1 Tax=Pseudonocardia eucalypti TaxID=648755 RepID=UPI0016190595|nr:hypothetical protein [Pseudonocardia eucalypti]